MHALYPNPAADRLHVEVIVVAAAQTVRLRLTELLGGRVVLEKALAMDPKGQYQADFDVQAVRPGQYAATLIVDGVPTSTQKVVINQ